jgi:hypothetical protein
MNTILYPIPNKYFPSVKVKQPFHAKVNYQVIGKLVKIEDVCLSPMCLQYITNTAGMVKEMKETLQKAEAKCNSHVNPIMMGAIAPYI